MALIFPIYLYRKLEKIFLSETTGPISIYLGRNVSLVTLYQDCSSCHDLSKNMAPRGRYLYRKLKIFLLETTRPISVLFCRYVLLVILYQDCSSHLDSAKQMAAGGGGGGGAGRGGAGWGLFSLYIYIENLKKSSYQKPLEQLQYYVAEMFLW